MSDPTRPTISTATPEQVAEALIGMQNCVRCHKLFKPRRSWQRFCSDHCRNHYNVQGQDNEPSVLKERLRVKDRQELELVRELAELRKDHDLLWLKLEELGVDPRSVVTKP
ncbi:MAG TPA: hypothetical protein PLY42_13225 [Nitrospira sp.]|nr:hypothetical protein [Nitrospira sp.]